MKREKFAILSRDLNKHMIPTVSVIIPSFNHERFIKECIESVSNQTFRDFEVIITDDGSTDNSVAIIKSFSDPRIKLFVHPKNRGACIAANNCISQSKGKYIAMLSSDDAWYPEKLAVQVKYLENHPHTAAVFGKVDWINENSDLILDERFPYKHVFDVKNRTRYKWLNQFFKYGNCLCHPCSLVRRECYKDIGLLNPALASIPDLDLWIRMCLKYNIFVLDQQLIRFRRMNQELNASGDNIKNRIRNRFENKQVLNHYLDITDPKELLKVFPEAATYGEVAPNIIPYFLGRVAIDSGLEFKILWGLEVIYNLLQEEEAARTVEDNCNFAPRDLIKLAGECDVYSLALISQQPVVQVSWIRRFLSKSKRHLKETYSRSRMVLSISKRYFLKFFSMHNIENK